MGQSSSRQEHIGTGTCTDEAKLGGYIHQDPYRSRVHPSSEYDCGATMLLIRAASVVELDKIEDLSWKLFFEKNQKNDLRPDLAHS